MAQAIKNIAEHLQLEYLYVKQIAPEIEIRKEEGHK